MTTEINAAGLKTKADFNNLVDELTYRNYYWNRKYDPTITPEKWRAIYGENVTAYEQRYQAEISKS